MLARYGPDDIPQIVFYLSGVASTLEQDVSTAYLFLAANYAAGDEVAVFGAGRGASAARVVVGLLAEAGLLKPGEVGRWARLWELYMEKVGWRRDDGAAEEGGGGSGRPGEEGFWKALLAHRSWRELDEMEGLRRAMWADVRVRVVGVWDTVGNLGFPDTFLIGKDAKCQLQDTALHPHIDHAFQALALDENRAAFDPSLWRLDPQNSSDASRPPNLKQCWFPGFHETVGGGATDTADAKDRTDIADITLAWMCDQVDGLLDFDDGAVAEFLGAEQSTAHQKQLDRQSARRRSHPEDRSEGPMTTAKSGLMYTLLTSALNMLLAAISIMQQEPDDSEGPCAEGYAIRTPGQYHKNLEFAKRVEPDDFATNESIHPSVKHRKDLFALASTPYDPAPLREWAVGDDCNETMKRKYSTADEGKESDSTAMTGWFPWMSALSTHDEDEEDDDDGEIIASVGEEDAEGRGANAINAATGRIQAAAVPRKKPQPRWVYREIEGEGDGAEWIRPSVPRSELFGSPLLSSSSSSTSSTPYDSPSEKALPSRLRTLIPAYLRRTRASLSSPLCFLFFTIFWPWFFLYHIFSFFFPFFLVHSKTNSTTLQRHNHGERKKKATTMRTMSFNKAPLQWPHERQIALPEWVIREIPGRRNFEAQLLPWLVREQLNRRNAKRLDWRSGEDVCWARSAFGALPPPEDDTTATEDGSGEGDAEVPPPTSTTTTTTTRKTESVRSGASSAADVAPGATAPVKRRAGGPLHVRKGSTAEVVLATASPAVERRQSQTAAGGGWRTGTGLKVLAQQPERRSSIKSQRETPTTGFSPGHKKTQSQSSVSWR
ncbi:protein of unknown function DUF2235 [Lasiodiplodia theobromae]|uniref:uncharacterized protein n=1 Tax=Lasiodiplodia theobromae TaxID=45133 RepID=UPI0015C2DB72|nr:uncharacterized protein LTHEOB_9390 [Lasiodiplodia theobromae]KAF4540294.1 hypothetical protein LTHEOB_9390 [Lasiodiplodia theobromae]KAF9637074.1 protein of unknown function DUF2235 [Lasiodiplodia theobromae]